MTLLLLQTLFALGNRSFDFIFDSAIRGMCGPKANK